MNYTIEKFVIIKMDLEEARALKNILDNFNPGPEDTYTIAERVALGALKDNLHLMYSE